MEQFISAVCLLALVVTGLLIMTQAISINEEGNLTISRLRLFVLVAVILCVSKSILAAAVSAFAWALRVGIVCLFTIGLVLVLLWALGRFLIAKKTPARRGDPDGGDL